MASIVACKVCRLSVTGCADLVVVPVMSWMAFVYLPAFETASLALDTAGAALSTAFNACCACLLASADESPAAGFCGAGACPFVADSVLVSCTGGACAPHIDEPNDINKVASIAKERERSTMNETP